MSIIAYNPERSVLDELFSDLARGQACPYFRRVPASHALNLGSALGEVHNTKDKFAVSVDVSHFKPEEVKVNLTGNTLTIEGHHEEKTDKHGSIQRSFTRKYVLPEDTNLDALRSSLSEGGHLTIEAPKKTATIEQARAIPITRG